MIAVTWPMDAGCERAWHDKPYRETLVLHDGRKVTLRPMHRSDGPALYQFFFGCLSFRARLMRFHGAINHLPEAALLAMTTQVPGYHVALAALAATDDGLPQLLAEARYIVQANGEAEFAIAVADDWQGQGLGRAMVQRLIAHARSKGIGALLGSVVPGNDPMMHLMAGLGAELRMLGAEVTVRLSI